MLVVKGRVATKGFCTKMRNAYDESAFNESISTSGACSSATSLANSLPEGVNRCYLHGFPQP